MKKFSIVLPIYGNEENLPVTIPYIIDRIPVLFPNYNVEIVMVNDGSPDNSYEIMKKYQKEYPDIIKIASFTKNFGQGVAWDYGISIASGDAIGVISADLQDPLELFVDMLKEWENGYQLVYGTRIKREDKGQLFSKITHRLILKFISDKYPKGGFDFFLLDKEAAEQYLRAEERNGSNQLLMLWYGFRHKEIQYERKKREVGKSGWTFSKKIKAFIDIFVTNSYLPLRVMSVIGGISALCGFAYAIYIVISAIISKINGNIGGVLGWSSIVTIIIFFSGLILLSLGIIGEYLWRIFDYVKHRPRYVVKEVIDDTTKEPDKETIQL